MFMLCHICKVIEPTKYHSQPPLSRAILPFYGNVESFFIWNTWKKCWCAYSAKKCTHGKTYEGYHKSRMSFQHLTREDLNLEQTSKCTILVSRITSRRTTGTLKAVEKCKKRIQILVYYVKKNYRK